MSSRALHSNIRWIHCHMVLFLQDSVPIYTTFYRGVWNLCACSQCRENQSFAAPKLHLAHWMWVISQAERVGYCASQPKSRPSATPLCHAPLPLNKRMVSMGSKRIHWCVDWVSVGRIPWARMIILPALLGWSSLRGSVGECSFEFNIICYTMLLKDSQTTAGCYG